ncbi:hypothetical protein [Orenia marismortui]|uniref:hypothetical protein n=1 Tax=Orenia marismortui TaxID=46469 RepID=UPI000371564D|nr:hypothetical protein [Orenia marismortui]
MIELILIITLSIILNKVSFKLIPSLLIDGDAVAKNYRGEVIPLGYGLVFSLNLVIIMIVGTIFGYYEVYQIYNFIILILAMSFIGLLDDTIGNKDKQGFSGHFKALLFQKKLTTGTIKALFAFIVVFFINFYINQDLSNLIINGVLILLMTNFINLLDLRPGRALKVTLFFLLLILILSSKNHLLIIPIIITVLFALSFDLQAKGMMGDIGSNVLGVILGLLIVGSFSFILRLMIISALVFIHLYSEFYSISELIKQNKILSYFDRLGR